MSRAVTAVFAEEAAAFRAGESLAELGVPRARIELHRKAGGASRLFEALDLPAEEFATHREAVRRGGTVLAAMVPDELVAGALAALEAAGALDLDARERDWREAGWSPAAMAGATSATVGTMPGTGGMDAEAARMLMSGTLASNTMGAAGPDVTRAGERDARLLARREPRIGRARSYVIEAPLAEQPRGANDRLPGVGGVA